MVSREVIRQVGWFDEIMTVASDYNYMLRALSRFRIHIIEETLYYHRLNPNSHRRNNYGNVDFGKLARERAKSVVYDPAEL